MVFRCTETQELIKIIYLNLRCSIPKCSYNKRRWRSVKHNSNIETFYYQLMHIMLKKHRVIKTF